MFRFKIKKQTDGEFVQFMSAELHSDANLNG